MPDTSLYMRIFVSATDSASGVMRNIGGAMGSIAGGPLKHLANGLGDIAFGLRNIGLAGTIGMDSIKMGAVEAGNALWKIASIVALVGAAVALGIGVMAVRAAADFQQGLNRLRTGAGDTQDSFASLSKAILSVSVTTGETAKSLTDAMYLILSSGQRGAEAYNTLKVAAEGAVIEQASVVDVANVVSGAMHNFGTKVYGAAQYMNGLIVAVSLGKITLQQLSVSMGPLEPLAHQLGISYNDLAAAMTTQTNAMIPAARAATSLRFMMQALEVPTKKAKDAMTAMGLDSVKVAEEMKVSLPGALQMIYNAAKKAGPEGSVPFNRAVSDMVGGQRSLSAFLALTGTHMKDFVKNSAAIGAAMKKGGSDVQGWAIAQSNANVQMNRVKAAGQALLITIGQGLLPAFTNIMAAIVPIIAGFTQWLVSSGALQNTISFLGAAFNVLGTVLGTMAKFFQQNEFAMDMLKAVLIMVAGVIAGAMVAALYAYIVAAWIAASATLAWAWPFLLIGAIIALVVAAVILLITHWGAIMTWLGGIFSWLGSHVHAILSAMGAFIGSVFSAIGAKIHDVLSGIGSFVGGVFSAIGTTIHDKLTGAKNTTGNVFSAIGTTIHDKLTVAKNFVGTAFSGIGTMFTWLYNHNKYIKALCDLIVAFFHSAIAWIQNAWTTMVQWIADKITLMRQVVGIGFDAIGTAIRTALTAIKNFFGAIFDWLGTKTRDGMTVIKNAVGTAFDWIGSKVHAVMSAIGAFIGSIMSAIGTTVNNALTALKNTFGNIFTTIGTAVRNALTGLWNWIKGFISGWPAALFNMGVALIQGLINGIGSMLGNLKNTLGNIAGAIGGFLGFHSSVFGVPPEGAGKDADKWMPALMKGLAGGIEAGIPDFKRALGQVIAPPAAVSTLPRTTTGGSTMVTHGPIHAELHIHAQQLDSAELDRITSHAAVELANKLRAQMGNV